MQRIDMWMGLIKQETSYIVAEWGRVAAPKTPKIHPEEKNPLPEEQINKVIRDRLKNIKII